MFQKAAAEEAKLRCPRFLAAILLTLSGAARADAPAWPEGLVGRLEALALVRSVEAEVLASRSATATLEAWCRDHDLAPAPHIRAKLVPEDRPATAEQRALLEAGATEPIAHRRVELRCGERLLSVADNWYLPGRLPADIERQLATTDIPFGAAIRPLEPYRQTMSARLLWSPLEPGWEMSDAPAAPAGPLLLPEALFEIVALLRDRQHRPISLVDEMYQRDLLAFRR